LRKKRGEGVPPWRPARGQFDFRAGNLTDYRGADAREHFHSGIGEQPRGVRNGHSSNVRRQYLNGVANSFARANEFLRPSIKALLPQKGESDRAAHHTKNGEHDRQLQERESRSRLSEFPVMAHFGCAVQADAAAYSTLLDAPIMD
jgi:hypothetical protein